MMRTRAGRVGLLGALYLVQGLPFGFQVGALPIYLREQGVGLAAIGYSTALAIPWALKFLWAPFVERFGGCRGHRKRWIVPIQLLMVVGFLVASQISVTTQLIPLMATLLVLNLLAATQDIAVDGLAVDLLPPEELGVGNAAQVVGYKFGMLMAGGVLVWASAFMGWSGAFCVMAALVGGVALLLWSVDEPPAEAGLETEPTQSVRDLIHVLLVAMRRPATGWALAVVATYKMGESLIDVMYKPFLLDQGITASEVGLWLGTWGMGASVLGSVAGGMLASRYPLVRLLAVCAAVRLIPELGQLALAMGWLDVEMMTVVTVSLAEHCVGGALTTVMFAAMMGWVDRRIGATHFTVFACVEVWGKSAAALVSGAMAERLTYAGTFGVGIFIGVAFLVLLTRLPPSGTVAEAKP
jgi:MFS family permease